MVAGNTALEGINECLVNVPAFINDVKQFYFYLFESKKHQIIQFQNEILDVCLKLSLVKLLLL